MRASDVLREEARAWLARDCVADWTGTSLLREVARFLVRAQPAEALAFALALQGVAAALADKAGLSAGLAPTAAVPPPPTAPDQPAAPPPTAAG